MQLLPGGNSDFDVPWAHQRGDHNCGPSRPWLCEELPIHGIHSLELIGVRQVHLHTYDICWRHSRRFQNRADILQTLFHFGFEVGGDFSRGVLAALTRNVKCAASQDSLTVIAARFGTRGRDYFFVGTRLPSATEKTRQHEYDCESQSVHLTSVL